MAIGVKSFGQIRPKSGIDQQHDIILRDDARGLFAIATGVPRNGEGAAAAGIFLNTIYEHAGSLSDRMTSVSQGKGRWVSLKDDLEGIFQAASDAIRRAPPSTSGRRPLASGTVLMLGGTHAVVGHVGKTRAYFIRGSQIIRLTQDDGAKKAQSERTQLAVPGQSIAASEQLLGQELPMAPAGLSFEVNPGDTLVLVSEAVSECVRGTHIEHLNELSSTPEELGKAVLDLATSKGATADLSCITISVDHVRERDRRSMGVRTTVDSPATGMLPTPAPKSEAPLLPPITPAAPAPAPVPTPAIGSPAPRIAPTESPAAAVIPGLHETHVDDLPSSGGDGGLIDLPPVAGYDIPNPVARSSRGDRIRTPAAPLLAAGADIFGDDDPLDARDDAEDAFAPGGAFADPLLGPDEIDLAPGPWDDSPEPKPMAPLATTPERASGPMLTPPVPAAAPPPPVMAPHPSRQERFPSVVSSLLDDIPLDGLTDGEGGEVDAGPDDPEEALRMADPFVTGPISPAAHDETRPPSSREDDDAPAPPSDPGAVAPAASAEELLGRAVLFEGLGPEHLQRFVHAARAFTLGAGDTLYQQDEPSDRLYVLLSGKLQVIQRSEAAGELVPLEVVGARALIRGDRRGETLRATHPSQLWGMEAVHIWGIVQHDPALAAHIYYNLTRQLALRIDRGY